MMTKKIHWWYWSSEHGKQSADINKERISTRSNERDQIYDDIDRHKDDKEDTMIYDEEKHSIIEKREMMTKKY